MAAIIHSSHQNLKWLKIRYSYMKQSPEVVFGCFYMFARFHNAKKKHLTREIMCQARKIYLSSVEYVYYKKGHMTQKTTVVIWYAWSQLRPLL